MGSVDPPLDNSQQCTLPVYTYYRPRVHMFLNHAWGPEGIPHILYIGLLARHSYNLSTI